MAKPAAGVQLHRLAEWLSIPPAARDFCKKGVNNHIPRLKYVKLSGCAWARYLFSFPTPRALCSNLLSPTGTRAIIFDS